MFVIPTLLNKCPTFRGKPSLFKQQVRPLYYTGSQPVSTQSSIIPAGPQTHSPAENEDLWDVIVLPTKDLIRRNHHVQFQQQSFV